MITKQEMEAKLAEIEADERLEYEVALVMINAPLALHQIAAKARADTLRWALGMPYRKHHGKD